MRVLVGVIAIGAAAGVVGCTGDRKIDREGTVEELVEQGATQEQAECIVDRVDAEFGDDQDVLDILFSDEAEISDLDDADEATYRSIITSCTRGDTTDTTSGG